MSARQAHTRTASPPGEGPDYCAECSEGEQAWVPWPCGQGQKQCVNCGRTGANWFKQVGGATVCTSSSACDRRMGWAAPDTSPLVRRAALYSHCCHWGTPDSDRTLCGIRHFDGPLYELEGECGNCLRLLAARGGPE